MLHQGVIQPTISPWASNVVLAKKKDGTFRCCIDYRQLNNITKKDAFPLPRTDACLDALSGSCWFSSFDLRSGFHQIELEDQDSEKTAFITRRGLFKFRTMPFGLCNAISTFQRMIQLVLTGLHLSICLAYVDDIILFSSTPEEHLERLEMLLQRLRDANLKLKSSKCQLMQREISFLGHRVSSAGIATEPAKVQLIKDWPAPRNLKELRGYLGLTGYYRRFVQDYSKIVLPLNKLMKKNQPFIWTPECQAAFEQLKDKLQQPPILALPTEEDVFILDTDAAMDSIGCVLSQLQNGQERVIAYAGRSLSNNERNYCITRRELLAIVYFLKYFRQYLLGRTFIVRTDHAALSWLRKTPEPIGQNARWSALIEEYDFKVEHRPHERHRNADALSRHPCLNRPSCSACHATYVTCAATTTDSMRKEQRQSASEELETEQRLTPRDGGPRDYPNIDNERVIAAQREDSEIKFVIELKRKFSKKPDWKEVELQSSAVKSLWHEFDRLDFHNDILCRKWTPVVGSTDVWQIIMPRQLRSDFVKEVHQGITGGHLGRSKTEEQVKRRAFWPNWRQDVAIEVKKCAECQRYHRGKAPKQTPLRPYCAGEPFEVLSIDITGPHPKSYKGNEFIVTFVDVFSKWAEAVPVRHHTAEDVAKALLDNIICRYGCPLRLISDRGREFESALFRELCNRLEIRKIYTSPYQPSSNAFCERFHRTLNSMLAKVVAENQRDWDMRLPAVLAAYRSARHESTGFSPNLLIFGHENRAPIDIVLGPISENSPEDSQITYDDFVDNRLQFNVDAFQLAREHLGVNAERRKLDYDQHVKSKEFKTGDWIWYYYPRRYQKRSPKWSKTYDGPFLVIKRIPPSDYVIQKSRRATPIVVHSNKLKLCTGETPESWLNSVLDNSSRPPASPLTGEDKEPSTSLPSQQQRLQVAKRKRQEEEPPSWYSPPESPEPRERRQRRAPRWMDDYQL